MRRPALLAALPALLLLLATLFAPVVGAFVPPIYRDVPPEFEVNGTLAPDGTVQLVWDEESDATARTLYNVRTGPLFSDAETGGGQPLPFYVLYLTPAAYRLGDTFLLCREWQPWADQPVRRSCHVATPRPNPIFLPLITR